MRRICPEWFQERLTRAGGLNPYGEPRFKLVWGESETMRSGGLYHDGFAGYRDIPAIGKEPCWVLMIWEPAEMQGSASRWYRDFRDDITGLNDLGQYPYRGRYRVLQKLIHREKSGDCITTVRMEPTHFIIDVMLPLIQRWQRLTDEAKVKAIQQNLDDQQHEYMKQSRSSLDSHRVRRGSALVQKKMEFLEKNMKLAMQVASRTQLGLQQR